MAVSILKEATVPADPAQGKVWTSIVTLLDRPGSHNEFVSVTDMRRETLSTHPWSLSGGDALEVLEAINRAAKGYLGDFATDIGFGAILGEDDAFVLGSARADPRRRTKANIRPIVEGDTVRDWAVTPNSEVVFPYDESIDIVPERALNNQYWYLRARLEGRSDFGGRTYKEGGRCYWSYHQIPVDRNSIPLSITFAFVATHNHFVLDRGGKVFKQSAPIMKLSRDADEASYIALLGLLNSSAACFWMKQVLHDKGGGGIGGGIASEEWEKFYEHTGTAMRRFPLPESRPAALAKKIDALAQARCRILPSELAGRLPLDRAELKRACEESSSLLAQMISAQEELDWWCYQAYGLIENDLCFSGTLPELNLGERAFEIVMARQMEAGELETTWFERHGSTPITELPSHWPAGYVQLVQMRIALIESHPWIGLIEKPEFKRRWNQPRWEELKHAALQSWLLDRLESPVYWQEPALQTVDVLTARTERDADFMAVAALYAGQDGFAPRPLIVELLSDESAPALKVLRYKDSGLRKRADWEHTWELQRREDAIDAEVAREMPRQPGETDADWEARLKPEQTRRKREQIGDIPAPPKYAAADFLSGTIKRLRGDLDVPKERFFTLPKGDAPGESLYGWAGWTHVQRGQAIASAYTDAESRQGWPVPHLIPLLAAVHEELPWVVQWHNQVDPELGVRLGDYFREWLGAELQKHSLTRESLEQWRPQRAARARVKRAAPA